ncbi:MAG: C40 family peptidase [Oscillospiraceae bacterium]|jgi:cell wall-associated NlpC family hydrolase|nr:C40 family peptidase [Oscillospiraceae bacterium]
MKTAKVFLCAIIGAVIFVSSLTPAASAANLAYGAATVEATQLNVRSGPSTSSSAVAMLDNSDIVVILEKTNSEWFYINFNGTEGYAKSEYFRDVLTAENFNATGKLTGDSVFIRKSPSTNSEVLGDYDNGTSMSVIGVNNGWYKVRHDDITGYVRSDYMRIVSSYQPDSTTKRTADKTSSAPAHSKTGNAIVDYALGYLGSRYVYGGASPSGFDCSGFTTYVFKNFGVSLTRNASGQYRDNGVHIEKSELGAGDLVFFSSSGSRVTHVGIYVGDQEFIHASTSSTGVIISRLDSAYYTRTWFGAKRVA